MIIWLLHRLVFDFGLIAIYNLEDIQTINVFSDKKTISLELTIKNKVFKFIREGNKWLISPKP